jgi:hypothetical protein
VTEERCYTTQLQAGLGLIEETRLLLGLYEPEMSTRDLFNKALESGLFPRVTARRLENIVRECFAPRYLHPPGIALGLKQLANSLERGEFDQLLFLHTARANLILADFVREVFWPRYSAGRDTLTREDAMEFVRHAVREGKTQVHWADSTIRRVSAYLLGSCADFGMLGGSSRGPRTIQPLRLHTKPAAYLAYDLKFQGLGDNQVLAHTDWQLFGLEWADVREQFKRLALQRLLILQTAGDVTHISWTYKTREELVDVLAR